jgi:hypothetical protein
MGALDAAALAAEQVAKGVQLAGDAPAALAALAARIEALESQLPNIEAAVSELRTAYTALESAAKEVIPQSFVDHVKTVFSVIEKHFPGSVPAVPSAQQTE